MTESLTTPDPLHAAQISSITPVLLAPRRAAVGRRTPSCRAPHGLPPRSIYHTWTLGLRFADHRERLVMDLEGLADLDDLERRLAETRASERTARIAAVDAIVSAAWSQGVEEERAGLRVLSATRKEWRGQVVRSDDELVYQSLFYDVTA